ncbi:MAG: phosphatase PAP2 family protein [Deltaproteobacteria bacterium]|nr:phosphatase PAP2 family protein [Deltaproteobacteria bacterium]
MNTETHQGHGHWIVPAVLTVFFAATVFPFDGVISKSMKDFQLAPDLRSELEALQQYGALSTMVVGIAIIWLVDPERRRRLLDWLAAAALTSLTCTAVKICIGRPRPKFDDPATFLGLWDTYPLTLKAGVTVLRHSWELVGRQPWDLWSMPSSHTALAAVMSVFLVALYPRLRPFGIVMVVLVGSCRVLFREHYPTDVIVGAAVGQLIARQVITACWGTRVLDWVWLKREGSRARQEMIPASTE